MKQFDDIYRGRRVLITGHTGFKGSWLSLWLRDLGAEVIGVSLDPKTYPNHWDLLRLGEDIEDYRLDIRDSNELANIFEKTKPEIVFHLAAQPLVRSSYSEPLETWSTNVMGTANVLEACRGSPTVRVILVITTDKCYENKEWTWGYRENDQLGGHDPYSASKAASELVAASYRNAFLQGDNSALLVTARAGNVIGGGDWSEDRLIPDLIRAITKKQSLEIRSPNATRPWQHVLESLSGYLLLGRTLVEGGRKFEGAWNFGPERSGNQSVAKVLSCLNTHWPEMKWHETHVKQDHEATLLYLDSSKAHANLGWQSVWDLDVALKKTVDWYRSYLDDKNVVSQQQLYEYVNAAKNSKVSWVSI
jgi:CDP-glucose 4,6-dehydratase